MNIAQVPRRFVETDWGGTETVILETSKRLVAMGHTTEIICPNALASLNHETIEGVRVNRYPYFYPYFGLSAQAKRQLDQKGGNLFSFSLMKALKDYSSLDLIHLHTAKRTGGIVRHIARKRRIPYVVSLHGGVFDVPGEEAASWTAPTEGKYEWGKLLGWWVGSRRVFYDAATIICVGEKERAEIQKQFPDKKVIHLPNGVAPEKFSNGNGAVFRRKHGIDEKAFVLLTVGRIDPQKNQMLAVNMLLELIKINPDIHLLLIGHITNDEYHIRIADAVKANGLENRVTIIPGINSASSDLADAYKAANIFLLPSIHEPFGIVILEAWASGLPVLASRVGGVPSFVEDQQDGLLFESGNEEDFINTFRALLNSPQKAREMAEAGKKKAMEKYSWDRITSQLIKTYDEAIHENSLRK